MKNFVMNLITNRLGIVLAILNVCYLMSEKPVKYAFSHGNVEECFIYNYDAFFWVKFHYAETMFNINLPALLAGLIHGRLVQTVFPDLCVFTHAKFQIIFLALFITIQWLFIGWTAQTIARAVRPKTN
jgi:hypothetical protein